MFQSGAIVIYALQSRCTLMYLHFNLRYDFHISSSHIYRNVKQNVVFHLIDNYQHCHRL